jgi:hypothetical protein
MNVSMLGSVKGCDDQLKDMPDCVDVCSGSEVDLDPKLEKV